jgi:hypothetical protein
MISVNIEPADNGLVKHLIDDNVNGAGEEHISRRVYDFEDNKRTNQIKFFNDLILDLGIDIGNDLDPNKLIITTAWGKKYKPSAEEIKNRIKTLENELKNLTDLIK